MLIAISLDAPRLRLFKRGFVRCCSSPPVDGIESSNGIRPFAHKQQGARLRNPRRDTTLPRRGPNVRGYRGISEPGARARRLEDWASLGPAPTFPKSLDCSAACARRRLASNAVS